MLFSGHIRNLGGISNSNLYTKTYTGTKKLIEDYLDAVCESFKFIHQSQSGMQLDRPGAIDDGHAESLEDFDSKQPPMGTNYIYRYFCESLQSLGRSALLLTGGFSLGMYHLGVVKALYLQNFLPDIICGIDIGSFVAALICCVPPERLGKLLLDPIEMINFDVFKGISNDGSMNRKIARYLRYGHFLNIKTLESLARSNIGDITFFESFLISKKILNITVSLGVNKDINYVLNYLTAPDIVVWSAACASASDCGLFGGIQILRKASDGSFIPWSPSEIQKASKLCIPFNLQARLASLFNVNHIIISKVVPYRVSFIDTLFPRLPIQASAPLSTKIFGFIYSEFKHLLYQLYSLRLLPSIFEKISTHFHPIDGLYERVGMSGGGSELALVISPRLSFQDAIHMFSIPTADLLVRTLLKGEQTIWPELSKVASRMMVEKLLVSIIDSIRVEQKSSTQSNPSSFTTLKPRGRMERSGSQSALISPKKNRIRSSSVH